MKIEPVGVHEGACTVHPLRRVCWTAIFVGAVVGVGLGFLLNLFGIAIGLSAVTVHPDGGTALAIGGYIGILIAVIASMFAAGYTSGYLGRLHYRNRNFGILYGFVTWSVALILSAAVAGHVSDYLSAYANNIAGPTAIVAEQGNDVNTNVLEKSRDADNKQERNRGAADTQAVVASGTLAYGAFLLFALFFLGAISSCVGGYCAMTCQRED